MSEPVETSPHPALPSLRPGLLITLTVIGALATVAAFAPIEASQLAWFGPALLMLALSQLPPRAGFLHGWVFGTLVVAAAVSFILHFGVLPWLALSMALGLYYGVFGLLASLLRHASPGWRVPALAGAWFLMEVARGHGGALELTFGDLAYSQYREQALIQIASSVGHYGVSFLIALLAAGLSTLVLAFFPQVWQRPGDPRRFNRDAGRMGVVAFMAVIIVFLAGRQTISAHEASLREATRQRPLQVAAVQAEGRKTGPRGSMSVLSSYESLSAGLRPVDLLVWPETAVTLPPTLIRGVRDRLGSLARRLDAYLIVGATDQERGCIYNSAFLVKPNGELTGRYRKMNLVVFGEYVPFRKQCPFLSRYPIRDFDYSPGTSRALFDIGGIPVSPLICFEGIFPDQTREVCRLGAQVIVIITSDIWARGSNEVGIHSPTGVFRAIESGRYVIRAASVGRSAIISPTGEVLSQVGEYENGAARATVTPRAGLTLYHRVGDWPLLIFSVLALLAGLLQSRRYVWAG